VNNVIQMLTDMVKENHICSFWGIVHSFANIWIWIIQSRKNSFASKVAFNWFLLFNKGGNL